MAAAPDEHVEGHDDAPVTVTARSGPPATGADQGFAPTLVTKTADEPVNDHFIPIQLPARVEKAQAVLKKQWEEGMISHKRGRESTYGYDQAYRVAWRNILDWIQAQMALLEIGMAKIEEVFLPYMQDREGVTFFERMEQRGFLLDSGKEAA